MRRAGSRSTRRATARRRDAKRYRLTLAGHFWLAQDDARRLAASTDHVVRQNRAALAQLRTVNNALIIAGLYRPRGDAKP